MLAAGSTGPLFFT